MSTRHNCWCVLVAVLLHSALVSTKKIGCKDESGKDVDWFINYKLPSIKDDDDADIKKGSAYAYILAPGSKEWTLSEKNVLSGSMMEKTLEDFYDDQEGLTYLFYNDDPPGSKSKSAAGHLKGVLVFDDRTGFWLTHSIPNFADEKKYEYPETALKYGQTALCVTYKTSELDKIANQLLFDNPNIYAYELTEDVEDQLDETARTLFSEKPEFIKKEPFLSEVELTSLGGTKFISFAKDNQLEEDLYSDIIAPSLKTSLIVETWRKGAGGNRKKECKKENTVVDVQGIKMTFSNDKDKPVSFEYTHDHSKWAVSDEKSKNYVCIADLNRMESQGKRGGGALCFKSAPVASAFASIIEENESCDK